MCQRGRHSLLHQCLGEYEDLEVLSHRKRQPHEPFSVPLAHVGPACDMATVLPGSGLQPGCSAPSTACLTLNSSPEPQQSSTPWTLPWVGHGVLSPEPPPKGKREETPKLPTLLLSTHAPVCLIQGFVSSSPTFAPLKAKQICLSHISFASTRMLLLPFPLPHPCHFPWLPLCYSSPSLRS